MDLVAEHKLKSLSSESSTKAQYVCFCGFVGYATTVEHLADRIDVTKRAEKNHEMHATRAHVKLLKKKKKEDHASQATRPPAAGG